MLTVTVSVLILVELHTWNQADDECTFLAREYSHALRVWEANDDMKELARVHDESRNPARLIRFMTLLNVERAANPDYVDALVWVSKMSPTWGSKEPALSVAADRARRLLASHHIDHKRIGLAMGGMMFLDAASDATEKLYREALAKSPHREVRGMACYWFGRFLKNQAEFVLEMQNPREDSKVEVRLEKRWGNGAVQKLKSANPAALLREAECLFARALSEFADVPMFGKKHDDVALGEDAARQLHELRDLVPGKLAPEIVGDDVDGRQFKLSDYRGRVVLLTFSANWCGPCRAMYPLERDLFERLKDKHFAVVSVNADPEKETLRKIIKSGEVTWPCWWDGQQRSIANEWNVSDIPVTYVIDGAGIIRHKNLHAQQLRDAVEELVR